ncbi:related to D-serine dehydratase [Saccharomycodes ludwigii]|uniref:D-serine dehydratase n=1 Tax=Saccharomycodes ludwigii TaxID=36035 RepID=A0A376B1B0_9ASCO|nr:hypothetical protein SCDLUD_001384 [Saccharomycodes ludwigii]KAH3901618.1 hypothetical protein SCDLUD_001384 [Saccharomycodes ludwigii]SSD58453.1 related to D-serine dehydratase [Saccharomycodes ludwigii]
MLYSKDSLLSKYKSLTIDELPTPSFVINYPQFANNCNKMISSIKNLQSLNICPVAFRPHVKTHKTVEGTLLQLGVANGKDQKQKGFTDRVLISTLAEGLGLVSNETANKYINDICYTLPITFNDSFFMETLNSLRSKKKNHFHIFIDHVNQLEKLIEYASSAADGIDSKFSVFIKIDVGTHRAGIPPDSSSYHEILNKLYTEKCSKYIDLYGFYAHAGHSYHVDTLAKAHSVLIDEIEQVIKAAENVKNNNKPLVLSVGATPTINSLYKDDSIVKLLTKIKELDCVLELHCGNYCMLDLQQVSTGCVKLNDLAGYVLGTVVSSYGEQRNEVLTNTGVLSLTRETSDKFPGFGLGFDSSVVDYENNTDSWTVDRLSQEHGILKKTKGNTNKALLEIGTRVKIFPQHSCITMNQFPYYFVVDENNRVVDIWEPLKGW